MSFYNLDGSAYPFSIGGSGKVTGSGRIVVAGRTKAKEDVIFS